MISIRCLHCLTPNSDAMRCQINFIVVLHLKYTKDYILGEIGVAKSNYEVNMELR